MTESTGTHRVGGIILSDGGALEPKPHAVELNALCKATEEVKTQLGLHLPTGLDKPTCPGGHLKIAVGRGF